MGMLAVGALRAVLLEGRRPANALVTSPRRRMTAARAGPAVLSSAMIATSAIRETIRAYSISAWPS